jgi:hypothetical protein
MADYWGVFTPPEHLRSPALHLKEQAAALEEKTKGLVRASMVSDASDDGGFFVVFQLWSPLLEHYRYRLLELRYPLNGYPLQMTAGDEEVVAQNEGEFQQALARVLGSQRTTQIVEAIMAQAVAVGGSPS